MRSADLKRAILISLDVVVVLVSLALTAEGLRVFAGESITISNLQATIAFALLWIFFLIGFSTYSLRHTRAGTVEYKRVLNATLFTSGTVGVLCYLLGYDYPRDLFIGWITVGALGLCLIRLARRRVLHRLHRRDLLTTPVLIAGSTAHVDEIAQVLDREKWLGYKVRGAVTDERVSATTGGVPVLGTLSRLPKLVDSSEASIVVFADGAFDSATEFRRLQWELEQSHVQMILAPTLADISAERLEARPVAGLPLVDVAKPTAAKSLRWLKRSIDVIGSALLLLIGSPFLLGAMLAIKIEDGGPILFRQRRVGLGGKEFDCLKLRSMCTDAEERLAALRSQSEGNGVMFKMKNDPRITKVGRFIRRYSIDELPQLWNTLVGDMSLVGPRPALPAEVECYDFDTRRRLRVRPGLTGLWQVSGRSSLSWEDTVRLDLYYVDNWSLVQDLTILMRTAKAVVSKDGAY
ncbi:Undecaprenyl-phosphate galactose phosphotransferase, WbaP/exopolysaccharide biosynthesis polyprenyl glycosylphosphotransferase [Ruaniaceae bacterium KH17]|nr:Undecaprenyl-phosphate galactose phosphotransferase, WbaP/exopolysaccharide biosynthesis polyprenyl glycosylphosphotransferase [Ruaniaceae bacterium KH17]